MRLLLAISKRSLSNSNFNFNFNVFYRRSCFFVTTATVTTTLVISSSSSSMSHAESSHHPRPSSLTSAALEFGGTALSILGTSLNELGETAKQTAMDNESIQNGGTRSSVNTLNNQFSSSSSSSSTSSSFSSSSTPLSVSTFPKDLGLQLSLGSVCGFCSGYALKKVGKTAAFIFGIGFISLQTVRIIQQSQQSTHTPFISNQLPSLPSSSSSSSTTTTTTTPPLIDWVKVENEMIKLFDIDGDGIISLNDMHTLTSRLVSSLSLGIPSTSAFAAAFFLGIRWG
jgi:uncharacterized membrane protein (Fun14 family)